jgi:hypothetical protein
LKLQKKKQLTTNPKGLKRNCNMVWIVGKEQQHDLQNLYKKERTHLKMEKDQSKEGNRGRMLDNNLKKL